MLEAWRRMDGPGEGNRRMNVLCTVLLFQDVLCSAELLILLLSISCTSSSTIDGHLRHTLKVVVGVHDPFPWTFVSILFPLLCQRTMWKNPWKAILAEILLLVLVLIGRNKLESFLPVLFIIVKAQQYLLCVYPLQVFINLNNWTSVIRKFLCLLRPLKKIYS